MAYPKNVAELAITLVPAALDLQLAAFGEDATQGYILHWHASLGAQPTEAQIAAVTPAQVTAAALTRFRKAAKAALAASRAESALLRAALLVMVDEFNIHSNKTNAILTAIDNSATFAQLKTAVLAIADLPQRTGAQLRTAAENKLDAGSADT